MGRGHSFSGPGLPIKRLFWALLDYNRRRSNTNSRAGPPPSRIPAEHSRLKKFLSPGSKASAGLRRAVQKHPERSSAKKILSTAGHLTRERLYLGLPLQAQNATHGLHSAAADTAVPTARPSVPKLSSARVSGTIEYGERQGGLRRSEAREGRAVPAPPTGPRRDANCAASLRCARRGRRPRQNARGRNGARPAQGRAAAAPTPPRHKALTVDRPVRLEARNRSNAQIFRVPRPVNSPQAPESGIN